MNKSSLISLSILFLILGGGMSLISSRISCMGDCYLIVSGDLMFGGQGMRLDRSVGGLIQNSPYLLWGIGGAYLIAGLVKADEKKD
ncbi:hypothetical protein V2H45_04050 [Tumidithrix elongata RA019]|uniref:Uncharacterized protein n=1 Tax=Tumidithrix elongata BACA0141 TaxID=2716417 RepID=A0AAW9PU16_9CYAN|nr:hypothetical protein [Tumidithrix elongata RA019]